MLLKRFVLGIALLGLVVAYLCKRMGLALLGRIVPAGKTTQPPAKEGSVYDTPVPDVATLAPTNAWRLMWESVPRDSRVLDVGCATGYLGSWLKTTRNCAVEGVDAVAQDLEVAEPRLDQVYLRDLDMPDWARGLEKYDVILMMDVLEHLRFPQRTLQVARQLLCQNGILIANVPNVANWRVRFELLRGRWDYRETGILDRTHVYFFTRRTLETMLRANNWEIIALHPTAPDFSLMDFDFSKTRAQRYLFQQWLITFDGLLARQFLAIVRPTRRNA